MWIGSGLDGIDGLTAGDPVTAEQMRAMFGCGLHPLAETRQQQLDGPSLSPRDHRAAARLGAPFKILDGHVGPFRLEVARRFAAINTAAGLPTGRRLPEPAYTDPGPLPWLPAIAPVLQDHPVWGRYLTKRSQLVANLADQVRHSASQEGVQPVWAPSGSHPNATLLGEIAVWRAALGVHPQDRRPTGEGQLQMASALWQRQLDRAVALCSHLPDADAAKREIGGSPRDHRHQDRHRIPSTPAVHPSVPPGPRL